MRKGPIIFSHLDNNRKDETISSIRLIDYNAILSDNRHTPHNAMHPGFCFFFVLRKNGLFLLRYVLCWLYSFISTCSFATC